MTNSLNIVRRRCEMFDSFCKAVLRNYARDLERTARRRENRELLTDDPMRYLRYFAEPPKGIDVSESFILMCLDKPCKIYDETFYEALLSLPDKQRIALLADLWLHMTDLRIAQLFGVTERTVYNWRQHACRKIKLFYKNRGNQ